MTIPKSAKTTAVALACAGTAVVAPALAPVLVGAKELFGGVLPAMFGEDGLGKLTLNAIAGFATELFGSAVEKLPEAWSKEHNYDLEKALATAYLESFEHLASETKNDELKEGFTLALGLWKSRISRALADETVSFLFMKQTNDGGFTPRQFILDLAEPGKAETLLADDVRHTLQRWANEETTYEQGGDYQQLGLSTSVPLPESLLTFLCVELPPEISHRFGQVVRRPDFNRSWIAFQQAHLLAINLGLRQFDASNQKLIEKVDALAAQRQFPEMLAEELAEFLSRARDQAAVREHYVEQIVERLLGLEQRLVGEIQQSKDEIKTDLRQVGEELKEEILKQRNRAAEATPHQLPAPKPDFTGSRAELDELKAHLRHDGQRGVAIAGVQGMGGVGKTELAINLAAELKAEYPDAQIFLDLRGVSERPVTSEQALEFAIRSLDPQLIGRLPEAIAELQSLYRSLLDGKRALLVWDNARDAAQVEPLIPPAGSAMIVTSRLHFTLPGLFARNLEALPEADARLLLLRIAPRLTETQAGQLAKLCGRLPLALRLVGSALAERPNIKPEKYAEQLADAGKRLALVDASLSLSFALLDETQRGLWPRLAVFPATFDDAAAGAVWQMAEDDVMGALAELIRYSQVDYDPQSDRYELHDLARLFADARMEEQERHATRASHAQHFCGVLAEAGNLYLAGGEQVKAGLALFDRERANIEAGMAWATSRMEADWQAAELCVEYPNAGAYVIQLRLHPREQIRWLETQLVAARRLQRRDYEGDALGNLGLAYADLGEVRKAVEFFEQQLIIAREISDQRSEGHALGNLGMAYYYLGEARKSIEFHEQSLVISREISDRRGEGDALNSLGLAYFDLGEARKAIEFHEQYLAIAREIGDRRGEGNALWNTARALDGLGERWRAVECAEAALKIFEEIESPHAAMVRAGLAKWRQQLEEAKKTLYLSTPHPGANPVEAFKLNLKYQQELAEWEKLTWLQRKRKKKPNPPHIKAEYAFASPTPFGESRKQRSNTMSTRWKLTESLATSKERRVIGKVDNAGQFFMAISWKITVKEKAYERQHQTIFAQAAAFADEGDQRGSLLRRMDDRIGVLLVAGGAAIPATL
jgi:tetratricopeptide (TPR) repeat protein